MFAPFRMGLLFGSVLCVSGARGPSERKRKPRTSTIPPRKKRAKMGTPSADGLVTRPASVFSLSTKPAPSG
jgi:hypothetical protein